LDLHILHEVYSNLVILLQLQLPLQRNESLFSIRLSSNYIAIPSHDDPMRNNEKVSMPFWMESVPWSIFFL
jgi:hypothetical protein